MLRIVRALIRSVRDRGIRYTISKVNIHLLALPAGVFFAVFDRLTNYPRKNVVVYIRGSVPDSDTLALLDELTDEGEERQLHILSNNQVDRSQLTPWEATTSFPQLHTLALFRSLAGSQVVFCKSDTHLRWYRIFDFTERKYVRLYHGPITKAYSTNYTTSYTRTVMENLSFLDVTPKYRSVGSDVERYFRASSESRHPERFVKWGYPRYNRIRQFIDNENESVLSDNLKSILDEGEYVNVLYAPTHKDGTYETTFFPFPDFDTSELKEWCYDKKLRIFLRPHPGDEAKLNHLVDNDIIYFAGESVVHSATELMPYMDGLITDYSSIYIEYLLFDRPIIFLKDNHRLFNQTRGLAFDYDRYFPGCKPNTFEEFLESLTVIVRNNDDGYSKERKFVRDSFLPPLRDSFLKLALSEKNNFEKP